MEFIKLDQNCGWLNQALRLRGEEAQNIVLSATPVKYRLPSIDLVLSCVEAEYVTRFFKNRYVNLDYFLNQVNSNFNVQFITNQMALATVYSVLLAKHENLPFGQFDPILILEGQEDPKNIYWFQLDYLDAVVSILFQDILVYRISDVHPKVAILEHFYTDFKLWGFISTVTNHSEITVKTVKFCGRNYYSLSSLLRSIYQREGSSFGNILQCLRVLSFVIFNPEMSNCVIERLQDQDNGFYVSDFALNYLLQHIWISPGGYRNLTGELKRDYVHLEKLGEHNDIEKISRNHLNNGSRFGEVLNVVISYQLPRLF